MNLIAFFLKHSRKTVAWSLVASAVSGACNAALLALINRLLNMNRPASALILGFAALCLILLLSRYISEVLLNDLGQDSLYSLRMQISRQTLAAPLRHLEQLGSHRVLALLSDDLPVITNTVLLIPLLCLNATVVVGCLVYIGLLSWKILSIVLLFLLAGIASYQFPVLKAQGIFRLARNDGDSLMKHFHAMLQGIKELKMHSRRRAAFLGTLLDKTASSFRTHNKVAMKIYTASATWGQTQVFVVIGVILALFASAAGREHAVLTGSTLAVLYMMTPLQIIMNMAPNLARANVAVRNVEQLGFQLSARQEQETSGAPVSAFGTGWRLQFKDVRHTYSYDDEQHKFVLGPLDLSFREGELVFITGGNGSGKTTFAKLLIGLYLPESGQILLNGNPVLRTADMIGAYRENFSAVFSDFHLFDQLLGISGDHLDETAAKYLRKLDLSRKVTIENAKFSAVDLSQGQRKRLALLTACLEDRPVYLFDEWAADQDPFFRQFFYLQLLPELKAKGKTVFVISHDDRYYHVADRLIKFDEGHIASDVRHGPTPVSFDSTAGAESVKQEPEPLNI